MDQAAVVREEQTRLHPSVDHGADVRLPEPLRALALQVRERPGLVEQLEERDLDVGGELDDVPVEARPGVGERDALLGLEVGQLAVPVPVAPCVHGGAQFPRHVVPDALVRRFEDVRDAEQFLLGKVIGESVLRGRPPLVEAERRVLEVRSEALDREPVVAAGRLQVVQRAARKPEA
ncbi:hypothetical protein [Streptomyces sp. 769]|uniref:hypothetical protein n=1 Tax=Streptomyces sp. 769 TaxID=1262452 RepID=UPI001EEFEABC|nr:hypothetical protein [Streptomyces sp. 769]